MVSSISFGIAHSPAGPGCMVPPISACPSNMIETNALRSSASASARRISRLSNGGADELTMMLVETLLGSNTQTAVVAYDLTALGSGIATPAGHATSTWPADN